MRLTMRKNRARVILLCFTLIGGVACQDSSAAEGQGTASVLPPTVTVCAAARAKPGSVVGVLGEFDGFGYDTKSLHVTLATSELCSDRGAGLLFATLINTTEREKLSSRRPRGKRDNRPGDQTELQGVVSKVEDGRFTYLAKATVVR